MSAQHRRQISDDLEPVVRQAMLNGALGGALESWAAQFILPFAEEINADYDKWLKEREE